MGLGVLYLRVKANFLVVTVALAAFASGLWDGLHALASLEVIAIASAPERFIPFTWTIARFGKLAVLSVGILLILAERAPTTRSFGRFLGVGAVIGGLAAGGFLLVAHSSSIPQVHFPEAFVKRPWDLPALVLLAVLVFGLYPRLAKHSSGFLPGALLLSATPDLLAQVHMSFLSAGLYDYHFQSAHALKLLATLVLCIGICTDFVRGFRREAGLVSRLERTVHRLQGVESELLKTEERFHQLTENIQQVFWLSNRDDTRIDYVSPAYEEIFGLSCQSLYQDPGSFLEVVHPEDREMMRRLLTEVPKQFQVEYRVVRDEGGTRWVRTRAFPIRDETGRVHRLAGLSEDITDQRMAQQALQASEARMSALFNATPDLLFRIDRAGRLVDYHAPDEGILYLPPDEFLGRKVCDVFPETMGKAIREHVIEALEERTIPVMEYQMLGRDGVERDFEARFVFSTDDQVLTVVRDITEQKRLEREVMNVSNREQQRIGHDLHDGLSQELTGAALLLQAVQHQLKRKDLPEADAVQRIEEIVQKAVSHTRTLARGLAPVMIEAGGLSAALEELANGVEQLHPVRCTLRVESRPTEPTEATATHLYRIAQQAVTNALKHAAAKNILIALGENDGRLCLSVEDDGVGIDAKQTGSKATGMGLHIMRYRARVMNATLEIARRPGGGTIVTCEGATPLNGYGQTEAPHTAAKATLRSESDGS
jgi:PAS domain S-box-containing protein